MTTDAIAATGLSVVISPEWPSCDIVFVHGFTGHPERTWTHKRATGRFEVEDLDETTSSSRFGQFLSPKTASMPHRPVFWPRDLLPMSVPQARILTFGYDTNVRHRLLARVSKSTVYDIAGDLLVSLSSVRSNPNRPLVFVAHSLGGIVVKEVLRRSRNYRTYQQHLAGVFHGTVGIIFFGTPHGGADPRGFLQHVAELSIRSVGFSANTSIINTLLPSSERLRELRDEFGPMAKEQGWIVHSFQEQYGIAILSGNKVVEDPSSCLNDPTVEVTEHIASNHMQMCRFNSTGDPEYRKFTAALGRVLTRRDELVLVPSLAPESRRQYYRALPYPQMFIRETEIRTPHNGTCSWLLDRPEVIDLLDDEVESTHDEFLWVFGHPGTGKSIAMKYLITNARRLMPRTVVVAFFFHARGAMLEKSAIGMYRSLLYQIMAQNSQLQRVFDALGPLSALEDVPDWKLTTLVSLFHSVIGSLGSTRVLCFVDALDECAEDESRALVASFEELRRHAGGRIRICLSSRHYPHISVEKRRILVLENETQHFADIAAYLDTELRIGHGPDATEIRQEVLQRSRGTFLWVFLVTSSLNKAFDHGHINGLRTRLSEVPNELSDLFRELLNPVDEVRPAMILCFQWVLFSFTALQLPSLYFAIAAGLPDSQLGPWDRNHVSVADMKRYIISCSRGLVEIVAEDSASERVQFIHESVSNFLRSDRGMSILWPNLEQNQDKSSHDILARCCINYLQAIPSKMAPMGKHRFQAWPNHEDPRLPLFWYACGYVLKHSNAAAQTVEQWTNIAGLINLDGKVLDLITEVWHLGAWDRSLPKRNLLLRKAAHQDLPYLIWYLKRGTDNLDLTQPYTPSIYLSPMISALIVGSRDAMEELLRPLADPKAMDTPLSSIDSSYTLAIAEQYLTFGSKYQYRETPYVEHPNLLSYFVSVGAIEMVRILLATGKVDINARHKTGRTPIIWAVQNGSDEIVQLLLETGKVELGISYLGQTVLMVAAEQGHLGIMRRLLATEHIDVSATDYRWQTALFYAKSPQMLRLLLETPNCQVNSRDVSGGTAFFRAVACGNTDLVEAMLVEEGIDVNCPDWSGDTPLMVTVSENNVDMLRILLRSERVNVMARNALGRALLSLAVENNLEQHVHLCLLCDRVDINAKDYQGRTALQIAMFYANPGIVNALLDGNKDRSI